MRLHRALIAALAMTITAASAVGHPAAAQDLGPAGAGPPFHLHECRLGVGQVTSGQVTFNGTLGVDRTMDIANSAIPVQTATAPAGPLSPADLDDGDYFQFVDSTTVAGTFGLKLFTADGALKRVVHETGSFRAVSQWGLVYLGGGTATTLITRQNVAWGSSTAGIFVGAENVSTTVADNYLHCSPVPLSRAHEAHYLPRSPVRIGDTRPSARMAAGEDRAFVVAGQTMVPFDAGAVALNVTVIDPAADGWVSVRPCGTTAGATSTVNFPAMVTVANATLVPIGRGGAVCVYTTTEVDLALDLSGYTLATVGAAYTALTPWRASDTRAGTIPLTAGQTIHLALRGRNDIATNAVAAALNVTVTGPATAGFVSVYPCGSWFSVTSNVNFAAGQTVANSVIAEFGSDGDVCIFTSASTHVVVDVMGEFAPTAFEAITSLAPRRWADTRAGSGPLPAEGVLRLEIGTFGDSLLFSNAAIMNVTVTEASGMGFITAYPCDEPPPWASNVNFTTPGTVANLVFAKLSADKAVCLYTTTAAHVVIDLLGVTVPTVV